MANVLITGGSGLLGKHLTALLLGKGYNVGNLTRSVGKDLDNIRTFSWNVDIGEIDEQAIPWAEHIIHLA